MSNINRTIRNIAERSLSALLAFMMLFALIPIANAGFEGKNLGKSDALNTLTVYKWHRVHTQSDLPPEGRKVPVLLMWKGKYEDSSDKNEYIFYLYQDKSGTDSYTAHGEDALKGREYYIDEYNADPFNTDSSNDTFYSTDVMSNITVKMNSGRDSKNQDAKYGKIWFNNYIIKGDGDFDWGGYGADDASRTNWSFYTKELNGSYAAPLSDAYPVQIYYERGGWYDTGIRHSGQWCYAFESDTHSYGAFAMYWGEELTISAITSDYTVRSGMVMNVDNGVLIEDGVTVTVMPGGVLSVEGQLYNNGTIKNYGTVVVQPDSCITCFDPNSSKAGTIVNSGEEIDTRADAQVNLSLRQDELKQLKAELAAQENIVNAMNNEAVRQERGKAEALSAVDSKTGLTLSDTLARLQQEIDYYASLIYEPIIEIEQEAAEAAAKATSEDEKYYIKRSADEKVKALKDENVTPLQTRYDELYAPIEVYEAAISAAKQAAYEAQTFIDTNTPKLEQLEKQIAELEKLAKSSTNVKARGEGNLIIMHNGRIFFNDNSNCCMTIKDGGSCVCSGYIVHPSAVVLDNGKLQIRKGGAVALGYYIKSNILAAKEFTPLKPDTLDFDFSPMYSWSGCPDACVWASGNYVIQVDGVLKYRAERIGIYNTTTGQRDAIVLGSGVWSTTGAPEHKIDGGVETYTDEKGNRTVTYPDGTTEYYNAVTGTTTTLKPNGNTVVKQANGTSVETWPDGVSYIKRFADGDYAEVNVDTDEYKMVLDQATGTLITEYKTTQEDGLQVVREYKNGEREEEYADGKRIRYNAAGTKIGGYEPDPSGNFGTYTYADRMEVVMTDGSMKSVEYTAGALAGATIVYDPLDAGVRDWQQRPIEWTVTTPKGDVTRCYTTEIDGTVSSVICFANGKTCTLKNREAEADYFLYDSSLWEAPTNLYAYDTVRRVLTRYETATEMPDGTVRYERTDGSFVFYGTVKDAVSGAQKEAALQIIYPSGATIAYEKSFYEKTAANRETGEILWTVTAVNGDTTTARIYNKASGYVTLFFTGENRGKTCTIRPEQANPEDYLTPGSAASYDKQAAVLPMPELGEQDTPDGGVMQSYTDGTKKITYSNGNYGEASYGSSTYTVMNKNGSPLYELTIRSDGTGKAFYPILKGDDAGESSCDYVDIYRGGRIIRRDYTARIWNNNYYGALIEYADSYYKDVSERKSGDLLWSVKAKDGTVTKCYVIYDGKRDTAVLYNDQTYNVWPTETEQAPNPEKYIGKSSPAQDSFKTSVTGDLAELIPALGDN